MPSPAPGPLPTPERTGLLVLPPYLVGAPTEGLIRYFETVAEASELPIIVYHRANAALTPAAMGRLARHPKIIGFKDGVGNVDTAQQIVLEVGDTGRDDFLFFNGLLTAELTQAAYRGIGIPLYSSAVFAMAPDIANAFYAAYIARDDVARERLLREFYRPLVALRDRCPATPSRWSRPACDRAVCRSAASAPRCSIRRPSTRPGWPTCWPTPAS